MFVKSQITLMLELQDKMNLKINRDWVNSGNDWSLAAMMESVEAIDHHGWKWWKKQTIDYPQLHMELVDIWHFILSQVIVKNRNFPFEDTVEGLEKTLTYPKSNEIVYTFDKKDYFLSEMTLVELLKLFTACCAVDDIPIFIFMELMRKADFTPEQLINQYIGKNVLNFFRQDNGYKDGTYVKIWYDGNEDNVHLSQILNNVDMTDDRVDEIIYANLKYRYTFDANSD